MKVLDRLKAMSMDEFYRVCNRLVKEMGFQVKTGVYRDDTAVFDANLQLPGGQIRYIIIFIRKDTFGMEDLAELVDFDTFQIRWMIITTGVVDKRALEKVPENMEIKILDGSEFEKLVIEFGVIKEESPAGRFLPSAGKVDEELAWAEQFLKSGNFEKALEHVNSALAIKSTDKGLKIKAKILSQMGKYDEALLLLQRVLEENVRDDEAWFILATVLENMGRDDEAEEAYGQCTRFNPRNFGCWLNRGNLLFMLEKYDEALMCYENALKIRQDMPEVWNNRGVVLKHMGKYDEAMKSYNAAITYDPKFAQAYLNKAILFYEMKRYEEAENSVYEYLSHEEGDSGYVLLANIYLKRQMPSKAEEMAKKAIKINPGNIEAREILRKVQGATAKEAEAHVMNAIESLISSVQAQDMEDVTAILQEARLLAEQGNYAAVREKLKEARELLMKHADEKALKNAIIADILDIANEANLPVQEGLEDMDIDSLRIMRSEMIKKIRRAAQEEKTKSNLKQSLQHIKEDLEAKGLLTDEIENYIKSAEQQIEEGNFSNAMETLISLSAQVERERFEDIRHFLIEDTKELLEDANMDVPFNIEDMNLEEMKELRKRALEKISGHSAAGGGLKDMVAALSGGSVKDAIVEDIHELAEVADFQVPEEIESMSISELKNLRKEIIEKLKSGREKSENISEFGLGHVLLEAGLYDKLFDESLKEDEYLANARGIYYFEKGDIENAIMQFKRAVALNPEFKEAEFNLGYSLYISGQKEEGLLHLKRVKMDWVIDKISD